LHIYKNEENPSGSLIRLKELESVNDAAIATVWYARSATYGCESNVVTISSMGLNVIITINVILSWLGGP